MRSATRHRILAGAVLTVLALSSGVANAQAPFTLLHSFTGTDGWLPASIIQGTDGNFYGTTGQGGTTTTSILGTVFKMTPAGVVTTLHLFTGGADGYGPNGIIQGIDGYLYGTTLFGAGGGGVAYRISTTGVFTTLHTFVGSADGYNPYGPLVQAGDGNFYGTTAGWLSSTLSLPGTIFQMTPAGSVTVLHTFDSTDAIGRPRPVPYGLVQANDGNFYGTTISGGTGCCGTVFRVTPAGVVSVVHSFNSGSTDGAGPNAVMQAADGNLYGTTSLGGTSSKGVLFRLALDGTFTLLHSFSGGATDGDSPSNALIQATDGNLYGVTKLGGGATVPNGGTVFKATTAGAITLLHKFAGDGSDGAQPTGSFGRILTQAADRRLYGVTWRGGAGNFGTAFRVQIGTAVPTDFDGDGSADVAVYRPAGGTWYVLKSSTGFSGYSAYGWGLATDIPVPGDYDGDGKADLAVFRPSTGYWFILKSSSNFTTWQAYLWGATGDVPVQGDYDGDGATDIAIYRPSDGSWYILKSSSGFSSYLAFGWGATGDLPVSADYDGDGRADVAIFRPTSGHWFILKSSTNFTAWDTYQWGTTGDTPVPGDYDGDGRTDVAVYRPSAGQWFVLKSSSGYSAYSIYGWGTSTDVPVPTDYDGDGKTDVAIYRPSTGQWYILKSSTNFTAYVSYLWGAVTDVPLGGR